MPDQPTYKKKVLPLEIGAVYGKWTVLEYMGDCMIIHIKRRVDSTLPPIEVKTVGQKLIGIRITKIELERSDLQAMLTEEGLRWTKKHLLPQMTYPIVYD